MNEPFDAGRGDEPAPELDPHVHELRAAYRRGRLVVAADSGVLARARLADAHAIDAHAVADAMLRELRSTAGDAGAPGGADEPT